MSGNRGMEELIPMVNQLQDAFSFANRTLSFDLPQIAVVGSQSAGKSSVLENFVGRDFLPRGSGIVTRRPLILQLVNDKTEHGEFLHCRGKVFTDFDEIKREIEVETDRLTGKNKGIDERPINLKIYSPHVLNLTLIDLPGLTKVPVGDQPADIELKIRKMITDFIQKDSCLILAVTPANSDLANSDALKLAKEFDPQGLRTICVLTKLDLMDHGTDAKDILENRFLPLRRGYVGIVNRSQRSIDQRMDIASALKAERNFFLSHASYRHMVDKLGTPYLQKVLNEQLTNHIKEMLPNLRSQLQEELQCLEKEVEQFQLQKVQIGDKRSELFRCVRQFECDFLKSIEGIGDVDVESLSGGAQLAKIITDRYNLLLHQVSYNEDQLRKEINIIIQNIHGVRKGLFTPDMAFDTAVRRMIELTRKPTLDCLDIVMDKVMEIVQSCSESLNRYPNLQEEVIRKSNTCLRSLEFSVRGRINEFVDMHLSYINTSHEDFIGFKNAEKRSFTTAQGEYGNQVICKGWLTVSGSVFRSSSRYFWFVLSTENLKWYKDDEEREMKYVLDVQGLRQRSSDGKSLMKKNVIGLYYVDPRINAYKDQKVLELLADSQNAAEGWRASLLRAGVTVDSSSKTDNDKRDTPELPESENSKLRRQVEVIRNLVDSYTKIINKTMLDTFPKVVMHGLLNKFKEYMEVALPMELGGTDIDILMKTSEAEDKRRQEVMKMYESIKHALQLMSELMSTVKGAPLPPPVKNDWLTVDVGASTDGSIPRIPSPSSPVNPHHSRPIPSRPAPNLPTRNAISPQPVIQPPAPPTNGQLPPPIIPKRVYPVNGSIPAISAPHQSASTGNLPMALSAASNFLQPPSNANPVPSQQQQHQQPSGQLGHVLSLANAYSLSSQSISDRPATGTPRIPPRPAN